MIPPMRLAYSVVRVAVFCRVFWRFYGGAWRGVSAFGADAALVRGHDGRARLDCACLGGVRLVDADAGDDWGGVIWRRDHPAIISPSTRLGNSISVLVNAAIFCHNHGAGSDF